MENAIVVMEEEKPIVIDGLVPVDAKQYNVEETTAAGIAAAFVPMLYTMTEMEKEYNAIIVLPISDKETVKKARELRLRYVKVRGEMDDAHKAGKAKILRDGKLWDAWKNTGISTSEGKEEKLKAIEKHAENLERERLEKLQQLRVALLAEYVENASELSLSGMEQDVFEAYLSTKKQQYEDRKAAELKAEQDRIAREKAEAEEREAQRLENIRLKEEADKREAEIEAERLAAQKERERVEAENAAKLEAERKAAAELAAKIKAENDAKLEAERKERERVEAELRAKKQAEEEAERARIAAEKAAKLEAEKLAKAPIKAQLTAWVNLFQVPAANIEHEKKVLIEEKFNRFLEWAKSEINNI